MRLLLDSHVVVWWLDDHDALGPGCRTRIEQADEVFVSAVTPWELGIKQALGKLSMPSRLTDVIDATGFLPLPITVEHAELAPALQLLHRDPFDRMLVAQAQIEQLVLVTADQTLADYDVEQFDART